jgi:hypothetical protein
MRRLAILRQQFGHYHLLIRPQGLSIRADFRLIFHRISKMVCSNPNIKAFTGLEGGSGRAIPPVNP